MWGWGLCRFGLAPGALSEEPLTGIDTETPVRLCVYAPALVGKCVFVCVCVRVREMGLVKLHIVTQRHREK